MPSRARFLPAAIAIFFGCSLAACNIENLGDAPPRARLYFPNALALSPPPPADPDEPEPRSRHLYVANSDFDLRYNAGTVQAYDLDKLEEAVDGCDPDEPARCQIEPGDVIANEVPVAAFSTAMTTTPSGDRVLFTTRTSGSLNFVNVQADSKAVLECKDRDDVRCTLQAKLGTDRHEDSRYLAWQEDPVAVISGMLEDWAPDGTEFPDSDASDNADAGAGTDAGSKPDTRNEYALVAHRGGQISLFVEQGNDLVLIDVLAGVAPGVTDMAYDPVTKFVYASLNSAATARVIGRFGVTVPVGDDGVADPMHASVFAAGIVVLQPVSSYENHTYGIAFLGKQPGLGSALETDSALIASQRPSALLLADVTAVDTADPVGGIPRVGRVKGMAEVGAGAGHVVIGVIDGIPIALVTSFDARELALVDLRTMLTRSVVPNLSGPYALVLDQPRKLVYLTDFRSSVIRILDLAPVLEAGGDQPIEVVATLGKPRVLQELR